MSKPDAPTLDLMKFGIGQPVPRAEDPVLVQGLGRYTDDVARPGQVFAAFARSPHAHGILKNLDLDAARAMPGVLKIYTGDDPVAAGFDHLRCTLPMKNADGSAMVAPPRPVLAQGRVRFMGELLACVIAETAQQARDAAEAVVFDIDPLPAVTGMEAALAPDAPRLHDDLPGNICLDYRYGDAGRVDEAFAEAAHVTRLKVDDTRVVVNPMEPRACIGEIDGDGRYVLHVPSQGAFGMRQSIADVLRVETGQVRILTGHVGGSFGMKAGVFPEYICLLLGARDLGRPVKWADTRSESFQSDYHGRAMLFDGELALDKDGRFLALRVEVLGDMGGYLSPFGPFMPSMVVTRHLNGMYTFPVIGVHARCVMTNTVPVTAYRGAGRPEANYLVERLIDRAAREMGIDAIDLRKRNHIAPEQMPYKCAVGAVIDSGEFSALVDRAIEVSDPAGYEARKRASADKGLVRGRGVGAYLEITAPPVNEMGGIRFEDDGTVTIITGTLDYGQGHASPFAQVLVSRLGIPFERIRLLQGDSDELIAGGGTGGSKSIMASGAAIIEASDLVIEKGKQIAGHILEAGVADIEFGAGRFSIAGTDRGIALIEIADRLRAGLQLPPDLPQTLDVAHIHKASPPAYPNGCHIAEVEIDPEFGTIAVDRYWMVNDFGTVVNPMLVEGQVHGGVIQGLGQALMERVVYDAEGQLITGSFMDYAMPRAGDIPQFHFETRPVPAKTSLLGAKGCGEAGCAGSLPAIMNAVVDALGEWGIAHFDMPATPLRVWRAIEEAKAKQAA